MNSGAAKSSSDCANTMAARAYPICFHMCSQVFFPLLFCFLFISAGGLLAQDTRTVTEPTFPVTCAVYHAPLQSTANGPVIGSTQAEQDAESATETSALNNYLQGCAKNNPGQAVELALGTGASYNAFLLNPITIPSGISLIIDGGVTVFGSRDPAKLLAVPGFYGYHPRPKPAPPAKRRTVRVQDHVTQIGRGIDSGGGKIGPHIGAAPIHLVAPATPALAPERLFTCSHIPGHNFIGRGAIGVEAAKIGDDSPDGVGR